MADEGRELYEGYMMYSRYDIAVNIQNPVKKNWER